MDCSQSSRDRVKMLGVYRYRILLEVHSMKSRAVEGIDGWREWDVGPDGAAQWTSVRHARPSIPSLIR